MDVDCDFDQDLLSKFSCMGTTDRDVLVNELQKLLDFQLNPAGCAFFLEMTNWNLQAAVCAYYDFSNPQEKLPGMTFVEDVTIGEGESVQPSTQFVKTWRIRNTGESRWHPGVVLRFTCGDPLGPVRMVSVGPLDPGCVTDVSVNMVSPPTSGMYQGQWRMCSPTGQYFGDVIWVIVAVDEGGLLGVTQQLSQFGKELGSPHKTSSNSMDTSNPFALVTTPHCSPQPNMSVPHNSPIVHHPDPLVRRPLFTAAPQVNGISETVIPTSATSNGLLRTKEEDLLTEQLRQTTFSSESQSGC